MPPREHRNGQISRHAVRMHLRPFLFLCFFFLCGPLSAARHRCHFHSFFGFLTLSAVHNKPLHSLQFYYCTEYLYQNYLTMPLGQVPNISASTFPITPTLPLSLSFFSRFINPLPYLIVNLNFCPERSPFQPSTPTSQLQHPPDHIASVAVRNSISPSSPSPAPSRASKAP